MYERLEAVISGMVQGVQYREYAVRAARALHLTGSTQNESDGTVSVVAEGPRELLEKFLERLRVGSLQSEVKKVEAEWYPVRYDFKSFDIYE